MHGDDTQREKGSSGDQIANSGIDESQPVSRIPFPVSRELHVPVLLHEALNFLRIQPEGNYIDATLGGGGHAQEILKRLGSGRLLTIDRDPKALEAAKDKLAEFSGKLMMQHGNFAQIDELHAASGLPPVDGVIADLGLSSMQLDDASRGFSFNLPGPLDMRMDPQTETTAADLVNRGSERDLADIFFELGEERHSRRIARAIVKARPYRITTELAQVVTRAIPSRAGLHQIHPATRAFMALRLAVNGELENLDEFLGRILTVVRPGGRVVVISFHSLEDRRVKQAFRRWQDEDRATVLTKKVVRPSEDEIRSNPRARSAKLRAAEKN